MRIYLDIATLQEIASELERRVEAQRQKLASNSTAPTMSQYNPAYKRELEQVAAQLWRLSDLGMGSTTTR